MSRTASTGTIIDVCSDAARHWAIRLRRALARRTPRWLSTAS
jgi:hypothetical protein